MSDYQFKLYEEVRIKERKQESKNQQVSYMKVLIHPIEHTLGILVFCIPRKYEKTISKR